MTNLIKSNFNDKIVIILQEQWTKECQTRELKSLQEFSKKEQWFKEIMQNMTKEEVRAELQLQTTRYERQLESIKQIDNETTNLIKSNFNETMV